MFVAKNEEMVPVAVDVNSGVETDGMKDKEKIQAVIRLLARSGLRKG